jgi:hypothetical protein
MKMRTKAKTKTFDCVEMKHREVRIRKELANLTRAEELAITHCVGTRQQIVEQDRLRREAQRGKSEEAEPLRPE